jgi:hypothetical protein
VGRGGELRLGMVPMCCSRASVSLWAYVIIGQLEFVKVRTARKLPLAELMGSR